MVAFICDACGNTVKKVKVVQHYTHECRSCSVLSCIDCGVDFPGDTYVNHNTCMTEAEKYQGHLYQAKDKENKGEAKQKEWLKHVHGASSNLQNTKLKPLLQQLSAYSNIPRKRKKFDNFCKNSVNVYDSKTLDELWEVFNAGNEKKETPVTTVQNGTAAVENSSDEDDSVESRNTAAKTNDTTETETNGNEESFTEVKKKKKKKKVKSPNEDDNCPNEESQTVPNVPQLQLSEELPDTNTGEVNLDISETQSKKKKKKYKEKNIAVELVGNIEEPPVVETTETTENEVESEVEPEVKPELRDAAVVKEPEINVRKARRSKKKTKKTAGLCEEEIITDQVVPVGQEVSTNNNENNENNKTMKKSKGKKRKHKQVEETQLEEKKTKQCDQEANLPVSEDGEKVEPVAAPGKFHWHKAIKTVLKESEDHEIAIKKLKKKVLAAYQEHGIDHRAATIDESRAMFDKKLKTYPKVKVVKELVKLIK